MSEALSSLRAPIDPGRGGVLLANMLARWLDHDPSLTAAAEARDESEDSRTSPQQARLHPPAPVNAGPSSPPSGESGAPICLAREGAGYPTRGLLAWYSRQTGQREPLPGAEDPDYVQTDGVWSPDGSFVVLARAKAKEPYPSDGKMAAYANDPIEVQIQYDLYRVPFNGGRGGKPEAIAGAFGNGMSNTFPKVLPDGRWIVFVKCRNAQLMRPDSQLLIVPARGGEARRMRCNTPLMNSWQSFSPNGHWLVFSSKARSSYTQMYLTHIDEQGNNSPAILVENSTAAIRAVNLPEFVNIPQDGIMAIAAPAVDMYKKFDRAV